MVKDGLLFGVSAIAVLLGSCCIVRPKWFVQAFRGTEEEDVRNAPTRTSELWLIRIFGLAIVLFGATFLCVSIFGTDSAPDFDPNLF